MEITPPKTNDMFETYYVRIDPDYGVYWLKAIGKGLYTNGYGDEAKNNIWKSCRVFEKLTEKNCTELTGEEGSIWGDSERFMYALQHGDRDLYAMWSKFDENSGIFILNSLMKDLSIKDH